MALVEHPQGVKPLHRAGSALLPVYPPEIHTLLLHGVVQALEVRLEEFLAARVKVNGQLFLRVTAQGAAHGGIGLLVGLHAVGGVQVQRHPHAPAVQFRKQGGRIGEQLPVPGIARPAGAVGHIGQVPVHVDHRHGQGDARVTAAIHQLHIAFLGVFMVAAPPVAQGIAGRHGHRAGQAVEVLQAARIVQPVAEEIQVDLLVFPGEKVSVLRQQHGLAVVQHGIALPGNKPVLHGNFPIGLVQGAGGAAQGAQLLSIAPHAAEGLARALEGNAQPAAAEGPLVVDQVQMLGVDFQAAGGVARDELHGFKVPAARAGGQPVFKQAVGLVFQANQPGGEKGQAVGVSLEDGGHRNRLLLMVFRGIKTAGANGVTHLPPPGSGPVRHGAKLLRQGRDYFWASR